VTEVGEEFVYHIELKSSHRFMELSQAINNFLYACSVRHGYFMLDCSIYRYVSLLQANVNKIRDVKVRLELYDGPVIGHCCRFFPIEGNKSDQSAVSVGNEYYDL
jgi:hypothetical protein